MRQIIDTFLDFTYVFTRSFECFENFFFRKNFFNYFADVKKNLKLGNLNVNVILECLHFVKKNSFKKHSFTRLMKQKQPINETLEDINLM